MRKTILSGLIVLASSLYIVPLLAQEPLKDGSGAGSTVTVGEFAAPGQLPGAVKLSFGSSSCTGSLISADVIITAAHCVVSSRSGALQGRMRYDLRATTQGDRAYRRSVKLSNANVKIRPGAFEIQNGEVKFHAAKDMALVLLQGAVPGAENRVVRLAKNNDRGIYIIAGWGLQLPTKGKSMSFSRKLMVTKKLELLQSGSKDRAYYFHGSAKLDSGQIVSVAACHGDSGGPTYLLPSLMNKSDVSKLALVAVTTAYIASRNLPAELKPSPSNLTSLQRVQRCAFAGSKSVSASIPANVSWINESISKMRAAKK